jgi:hypothetical protein
MHIVLQVMDLGFLDFLFSKPRSGSYGRLVAWVEKKYGPISKDDGQTDVEIKFSKALREAEQSNPKASAGLKRYVELGKHRGLIKKN